MTAALRRLHAPRQAPSDIGALAAACLRDELAAFPKPGLVSFVDSGSHGDMDAATFEAGIGAISPFLTAMAEAGRDRAALTRLRRIGLEAEATMMAATGGINTHRGAVFGLGLLCAAAGLHVASGETDRPLGALVAATWGEDIRRGPALADSHGTRARLRHGAGGARAEAACGFPSVYGVGLPAYEAAAVAWPGDPAKAAVAALFALMATVEDTNLLHRGGVAGLAFARASAERFRAAGGVGAADWRLRALACHQAFMARRLSPGGSADLLAMTLFVARVERAG